MGPLDVWANRVGNVPLPRRRTDKREDRDFGGVEEAEREARPQADAGVHVEGRIPFAVEAAHETLVQARNDAIYERRDAAMRVARELQVGTMTPDVRAEVLRPVLQQDAEVARTACAKGRRHVRRRIPVAAVVADDRVVHARQREAGTRMHTVVHEESESVRAIPLLPAEAVLVELVVARHPPHAVARPQALQRRHVVLQVGDPAVHIVAREADEVGLRRVRGVDDRPRPPAARRA